jgi:hypothetical protein
MSKRLFCYKIINFNADSNFKIKLLVAGCWLQVKQQAPANKQQETRNEKLATS